MGSPNNSNCSSTSNKKIVVSLAMTAIVQSIILELRKHVAEVSPRVGRPNVQRNHPTMREIFDKYTPAYIQRTYRMTEDSFWQLLNIPEPHMKHQKKRKRGATQNGDIVPALHLSMALRYFAGGDPPDIGPVHGVHPNEVLNSVTRDINAVHCAAELKIGFPENYADQHRVADEFKEKSSIGFWNCAGAIHGILIWTYKPR